MRVYKLTDSEGLTYGGTQWGEGITHMASGEGKLCGPGWIHAYTHPLLAVLLDPLHAGYLSREEEKAILWEADTEGKIKSDYGLKLGVTYLTTKCRIPVPPVTLEQRVRFGVLCAMEVYDESSWLAWARGWLEGTDRSANAAADAADEVAYGARAGAAADAARAAAESAACAAYGTTESADCAAYNAAKAATYTAEAAYAANAASAAAATPTASQSLDLIAIAEEALNGMEEAN